MPKPETHLRMKLFAEKNRPSFRRPVTTSLSSTTSAIIEDVRMPTMMEVMITTVEKTNRIGKSAGEPFAGNKPRRRRIKGSGPTNMPNKESWMDVAFLPKRHDRGGASIRAPAAER